MKKKSIVGLIITIVVIAAFLVVVIRFGPDTSDVAELDGVEVREYQGENLSSVNDFRENSIKGPQYVDIESYRLNIVGLVENPKSYTYEGVIQNQHYKKVVRLNCVEGWSVNILWEGVLVRDLLEKAKPLPEAASHH